MKPSASAATPFRSQRPAEILTATISRFVIPRESGVPSKRGRSEMDTAAATGSPAFAGDDDGGACDTHAGAHASRSSSVQLVLVELAALHDGGEVLALLLQHARVLERIA